MLATHSSSNTSVRVTELVPGSLTDEVQRVSLRAESAGINGTFRLETGSGIPGRDKRDRVESSQDDRIWTCELGAYSTAEEVRRHSTLEELISTQNELISTPTTCLCLANYYVHRRQSKVAP